MVVSDFKELPVLGIIRGINQEHVKPLTDVLISSGLKTVEITMNTDNAASLINEMKDYANGQLTIGAGTVLSMDDLVKAMQAGASFIVMPSLIEDVMQYCVQMHIPVFPGALTPGEIYNAWSKGATMVKVFPSGCFGPKYMKEIKGPFNNVELLACSGINENNLEKYFEMGASAISFGGSVFQHDLLEKNQYQEIEKKIKRIILAYQNIK